jgi:3alpha(or 20beta)-hydroxysteroid dehydrogenase
MTDGRGGRLEGRVALITGGASGQGEAEATLFAAEGATVVVADITDDAGKAVVDAIGDGAHYVHLDVAVYEQWLAVAREIEQRFGRLDVLVNNAGIGVGPVRIDEIDLADHHRLFDINVHGVFYGIRTCLPLLKTSGNASVINTSSIDGIAGVLGMSSYAATKFAVTGITKSTAIELGAYGIRVNSIHPGVIATPMVRDAPAATQRRLEVLMARQPIPRAGTAAEIAKLALFLASDDSSYCTGAEFVIDGGHLAGPYRDPLA